MLGMTTYILGIMKRSQFSASYLSGARSENPMLESNADD